MFEQFQNNQLDYPQSDSESEYEVIEIYERDRYDPKELYPSNINFILPGKQKQIIQNNNFFGNQIVNNKQNSFSSNYFEYQRNQNNSQFNALYSGSQNINQINGSGNNLNNISQHQIIQNTNNNNNLECKCPLCGHNNNNLPNTQIQNLNTVPPIINNEEQNKTLNKSFPLYQPQPQPQNLNQNTNQNDWIFFLYSLNASLVKLVNI